MLDLEVTADAPVPEAAAAAAAAASCCLSWEVPEVAEQPLFFLKKMKEVILEPGPWGQDPRSNDLCSCRGV